MNLLIFATFLNIILITQCKESVSRIFKGLEIGIQTFNKNIDSNLENCVFQTKLCPNKSIKFYLYTRSEKNVVFINTK